MSRVDSRLGQSLDLGTIDQAHIPATVTKGLQKKALMEHYQQRQMNKQYQEKAKIEQRQHQNDFAQLQRNMHHDQIHRRRMEKERQHNEYAQEFDKFIEQRKQREQMDKKQTLWLEKRLLEEGNKWLPLPSHEKQVDKQKKFEYGKELDRCLKAEEDKRQEQARKMKEQREKVKQEADQVYVKEQQQREQVHRRRSMFEQAHRRNIGMKDLLNWSNSEGRGDYARQHHSTITPRLDHMLKVHQRQTGDKKGDYKSQHHARYYQHNDPQQHHPYYVKEHAPYNTITNPITHTYKNPVVLKMLHQQP